jgi:hypothetical protein
MARAAALLAVLAVIAGCGSGGGSKTTSGTNSSGPTELGPSFDDIQTLPGAQNTPPPWTNGSDQLQLRLRKIGLPALQAEGQVLHIHQHLDLYVDGRKVTVPMNVGIDPSGAFISPLHTHDTTGVIHVESPTESAFSLGQFFAVWGVPLAATRIGSVKGRVHTWVNGKPVTADPTRIVLASHQEIVIASGPAPKKVPSSYAFPEGL